MMFVRAANLAGGPLAWKPTLWASLFRTVLIYGCVAPQEPGSGRFPRGSTLLQLSDYFSGQAFRVAAMDFFTMAFSTFRSMSAKRFT